jgi:tRNA dimethylallyltransferase
MPGSRGSLTEEQNKKALVVCGPTASGKSEVSDALADALSREHGAFVPTLVVDSMQVYCEIPTITNQARRRPAELVGIVSVTEEWTVARHRALAEEIIAQNTTPFVLDAGTGMYLNAILLDVPLAPKVEPETRKLAQSVSGGATNPRRAARAK